MSKAIKCGFELLPHPPYFPDLAPSDYHLFSNMKKQFRRRIINDDDETKAAVTKVLEEFPAKLFKEGLQAIRKVCTPKL